ncbi:MAG: hypothetical protein CME62_10110 [Halobacteriovoraceae bacterium]|nr:hypothetical protein [Halobacteriovoraceae bacterium]|tara:strand:- start:15842 stop:16486 length:645 start_codon:yes stop_codon:yes gene_type:complete
MTVMQLQGLVTHKNKNIYIPLLTMVFLILYSGSGALSIKSAGMLPLSSWESAIPFLPWTIWIYIVFYPLYLIWALYNYQDEVQMNKTLYGFIILTVISCLIFVLFPITYPRSFFPLPLDNDITTLLFRGMRKLDNPSNCLPSLHVGLCYLFAYGLLTESRKKFIIAIASSTLIAISTLTTKQHYFLDILAGFLLSTLIYVFFRAKTHIKIKPTD